VEIILAPYKDPSEGLDWHEQTPIIIQRIDELLSGYEEALEYTVRDDNLGVGADWPVIIVTVGSIAGAAFFLIPEAHKRVREALEEWKLIGENIKKLIGKLKITERVLVNPVELLMIEAVEQLNKTTNLEDVVYLGFEQLSQPGSHEQISGAYAFRFELPGEKWEVVIAGDSTLITKRRIK